MNQTTKTVFITGASRGIGRAIAIRFAAAGYRLALCCRHNSDMLRKLQTLITEQYHTDCLIYTADTGNYSQMASMLNDTIQHFHHIDVLVNNAGILEQGLKPIDKFLDEDMDRIIETNEKGTMRCMRAASKRMTTGGAIVNVASVAGDKGCGGAAYVASKAAVIGLTKHTALRFQKDGIRCNAICPGNIITPLTMGTDPKALDPDMIGAMMTHSDIKAQSCTAEDVANVVLFFASDEARAITGQIIVTDFGAML